VHVSATCWHTWQTARVLGKQEDVDRFYVEFGQRLRAARMRAGMSQEAVGVQVGLNRTSISNVEKGRQRILLHHLPILADRLGTSIDELLPSTPSSDDVLSAVPDDARAWVLRVIEDGRK
jgi:transcriptional regulator with XRE-family HTH domain